MNAILNKVLLENTIQAYLGVAFVMFLTILFGGVLSKFILKVLYRLFKKYTRLEDIAEFEKQLKKPIAGLLILSLLFLSLQPLHYPTTVKLLVFGKIELKLVLIKIGWIALTLLLTWFLLNLTNFLGYLFYQRTSKNSSYHDEQVLYFTKDLTKVIIGIISVLFLLGVVLNLNIASLLGAAGIATLAIALAAKETLENLIASIIIFIEQPFAVGDTIKIAEAEGKVEKIGFRSTTLRSNDKTLQTIPNKKMVDSITENLSHRTSRRVKQTVELQPNYEKKSVENLLSTIENTLKTNTPKLEELNIHFVDIIKGSIIIEIEYVVTDYTSIELKNRKQENTIALLNLIQEHNFKLTQPA